MRFAITIAAAATLLALAIRGPALAEGRYVTEIDAKHKLIEQRRPKAAELSGSAKALRKLNEEELARYNALRFLARPDPRLAADPNVPGRYELPPLGSLEASTEHQADPWVLLRLTALLRAGYPSEPNLCTEILRWLESASPVKGNEWSDVSLELLLCDAIARRADVTLTVQKRMTDERARAIVSKRLWLVADTDEPSQHALGEVFHYLLARRLALKNGWAESIDAADCTRVLAALARAAQSLKKSKGTLWDGTKPEQDAFYCRGLVIMAACLGLGESDASIAKATQGDCRKALGVIEAHLKALPKDDAWRAFEGDALALLLAVGKPFDKLHPKKGTLVRSALGNQRMRFMPPRPGNSHCATALRWVLTKSFGDAGLGRSEVQTTDRDQFAGMCLAVLASVGGFNPDAPVIEPLDWGESVTIFSALDSEDLDDYYGYIVTTDLAIDASANWFLRNQKGDGTFGEGYGQVLGGHALVVHALLDAGVPRTDKRIQKAMAQMLALAKGIDGKSVTQVDYARYGSINYSANLLLMAFQSYYEHDIRESGMYQARTRDQYLAAQQVMWPKVDAAHRELIANLSWRLSNCDGYGWGYVLHEPKAPMPSPVTNNPKPKAENPTTGDKADSKRHPELEEELDRRKREGKFPERSSTPANGVRHGDNSNSQYAVLGLKAALLMGAPVDYNGLAYEAVRLCDGFLTTGQAERVCDPTVYLTMDKLEQRSRDNRYAPDDPNATRQRAHLQAYEIGGWSYHCGAGASTWGKTENDDGTGKPVWPRAVAMTAAGLSSLAIIRDALMVAPIYDPELIGRIDDRIAGGMFGLGLMYPYSREHFTLDANKTDMWFGHGGDGWGMMYDMYSCERAGVMTDTVFFANVDWYRDGADILIKEQGKDGGWEGMKGQICNHAFALLFLRRAAPYLATKRPPAKGPVTGK